MFNINDPFYQDICTPFDSSNETDILLIDRINYIYHNDDTQCQSNCQFSYYSIESQYIQCSCSTNENIEYDKSKNDKFSSKKLYESFYDVLKYSNYNIPKCYKIITNIDSLKSNIGNIITILFFCCYLMCLLFFIYRRLIPLKMKLNIDLKNNNRKNNLLFKSNIKEIFYPPIKKNKITNLNPIINKRKNNEINIYSNSSLRKITFKKSLYNKKNTLKIKSKIINNKEKEKIEYSDYQLNELEYEKAINYDKRTLFQMYWGNLKREHLIIFTFCS